MPDLALIDMIVSMAPPPQEGQDPQGGGLLGILPPMIMMFLIFYFVLIRPQQKKQAEAKRMVDDLKEGDNVITLSGIHGMIKKLKEDVVTLQVAENVRIKINRTSIGMVKDSSKQTAEKDTPNPAVEKGKTKGSK